MHIDSVAPHESICRIIGQSLAGTATAEQEQTLREHLPGCVSCSDHLNTGRRAIAALQGFSFDVDPVLERRVLTALAQRTQQLETNRARRRQMGWGALLALLFTAVGSLAASRLGGLAAPTLHLDPAQLQFGLAAFWITPSLIFCLLLLLLPALQVGLSAKKGLSL